MPRSATPDDCAEAVLALVRNRYASGEVFVVDGDEGERAPHDRERAARGRLPRTRANGDAVEAVSNRSSGRSGIPARSGHPGRGWTGCSIDGFVYRKVRREEILFQTRTNYSVHTEIEGS